MENSEQEQPELCDEARAALQHCGGQLLSLLESMRDETGTETDIEPLDPRAALTLRLRGENLLADLQKQRGDVDVDSAPTPPPRKLRHQLRLAAVAAIAVIGCAYLLGRAAIPSNDDLASYDAPTPVERPIPTKLDPIPEPSSALLTLLGSALIIGRRRRRSN